VSERGSYLMNRTEKNTNGIAAGLQQEQEQEWGPDQLAELVAVYMADKPALTFRLAWDAYVSNEICLAEAAAALGSTVYQFLEMGKHFRHQIEVDIPHDLWSMATPEQKFLMKCLPQRLIDILARLMIKDLLIPKSRRYLEPLWEDLRLLRNLRFVEESDRDQLYQYTLAIGEAKNTGAV